MPISGPRQVRKPNNPMAIHEGVPAWGGSKEWYPWAKMKIGDVLYFDDRKSKDVHVTAWKAGKRHGFKFSTRQAGKRVEVRRIA